MAILSAPRSRALCVLLTVAGLFFPALHSSAADRQATAEKIADTAGLQQFDIQAGEFLLRAWIRIERRDRDLSVYIEGDGHAWVSRTQRSADPTPINPLGLRFASWDDAANVAYLARPCQYIPLHYNPACNTLLWTDERFSEQVIDTMDNALDAIRLRVAGKLHLAGFSGGGAVAALLAARRSDVASLRTFAGNLDHAAVNRHHQVSPMPRSLNPIAYADRLGNLPQLHYSGARDTIVTPEIADLFMEALPTRGCAEHIILNRTTHHSGWYVNRELLKRIPQPTHAWCQPGAPIRWRRVPPRGEHIGH